MPSVYVFVLGRPCSGKSTVRGLLGAWLRRESVDFVERDDFTRLEEIFQEDIALKRHAPTTDGGVKIIDQNVWEDLDSFLSTTLEEEQGVHACVLVELARCKYAPLMERLPTSVVASSSFVYVAASLETAWQRNLQRRAQDPARYISREEMFSTFSKDDFDALKEWTGARLMVIENEGNEATLLESVVSIYAERVLTLLRG